MKKNRLVYYSTSKEELMNYYDQNSIDYKIDVIDYLRIIGDSAKVFQKLKECYQIKTLTKKQINRLNIIQYHYFLLKNDDYNMKKIKRELKKTLIYEDSFLFDFLEAKNFNEQISVFDKYIYDSKSIKKLYQRKHNRNCIELSYLENLNRNDKEFKNTYVERKIKKHIYKILKSKRISIAELLYLWQILCIFTFNFISIKIIQNKFFIEDVLLKKILEKLKVEKEVYIKMLNKKLQISINESIVATYQLLLNKEQQNNQESLKKDYKEFIDQNKENLNANTVFLNHLVREGKFDSLEIIERIKKSLCQTENDITIMDLAFLGLEKLKPEQISDYSRQLEEIIKEKNDSYNSYNLKCLEFAIRLINFWEGESFDLSFLDSDLYLAPFLKICFEYDQKKKTYSQFLDAMNSIDSIPYIFNWNRLDKMFESTNSYEWFVKILEKMKSSQLKDPRLANYIKEFYEKLIASEKNMLLRTFSKIDKSIRSYFDSIVYLFYSILVHVQVYENYDDEVRDLLFSVIKRFDELEKILGKDQIKKYFYFLVSLNIQKEEWNLQNSLLDLILKHEYLQKNKILLFGLCYNNQELLINNYNDIFDSILDLYENTKKITKEDYSIIAQITQKLLKNSKYVFILNKNQYYHLKNKNYILKEDYDKNTKLQGVYRELNFKTIDTVSENMEKDDFLYLLTHRIFFQNIEQMNAGMIIDISKNRTRKELLLEMEKAIGYNEVRKELEKIRNGFKVDTLWFNLYDIHTYFKDVELANNKMFSHSKNGLLVSDSIIFHLSSLILAAKIDILDIIKSDEKVYITEAVYEDLKRKMNDNTIELADGIIDPKVNYDDLLDKLSEFISDVEQRMIKISKANIMGIESMHYLNQYDQDIFKFFVNDDVRIKQYHIVTEDPFYYDNAFENKSYGIYSYIVRRYLQKSIKSDKLLEITEKLISINYGFNIQKELYIILLERADDDKIKKIVDKIKDFVI